MIFRYCCDTIFRLCILYVIQLWKLTLPMIDLGIIRLMITNQKEKEHDLTCLKQYLLFLHILLKMTPIIAYVNFSI